MLEKEACPIIGGVAMLPLLKKAVIERQLGQRHRAVVMLRCPLFRQV
jgi:DNA integrity scanning protein DisA with diadenylate cyclase activity